MLAVMRWIMEGNRGLVYVRVMRTPSAVIYPADYVFELGRASVLLESSSDRVVIVTSGRQVHESLKAADICRQRGVHVGVIDMPSVDDGLLVDLLRSDRLVVFAEQNDGYILQNSLKAAYRALADGPVPFDRALAVNTLGRDGRPWFVHSATYEELIDAYGLAPEPLARTILDRVAGGGERA
jgi:transketolase C-terminal domain/subunit